MTEALRIGILGTARIAGAAAVGPAHATGDRLVAVGAGIRDPGPGTRDPQRAAFAAGHACFAPCPASGEPDCDLGVMVHRGSRQATFPSRGTGGTAERSTHPNPREAIL